MRNARPLWCASSAEEDNVLPHPDRAIRRLLSTMARRRWSASWTGRSGRQAKRDFYFNDTRLMSAWVIRANGEPWALLNGGAINYFAGRVFMVNRAFRAKSGPEHNPALCGQLPDKHSPTKN